MANPKKKGKPSNISTLAADPGAEQSPLLTYPPRVFNLDSVDLAQQAIEQFLSCRPLGFGNAPEEMQVAWWSVLDSESGNGSIRARFDFEYDRMPRRVSKGVASILLNVRISRPTPRKIFVTCECRLKGSFSQYPAVLQQAIKITQVSIDLISNILFELSRSTAAPKIIPSAVSHRFRPQVPWYMPDPDEEGPPVAVGGPAEPEIELAPVWVPKNAWPTMQEYNEAVQNPGTSFCHEGLRNGEVECNNLGLPKAVSGGFATVYKVMYEGRAWAVRCFNTPVRDHAERYKKVAQRIAQTKVISSFTHFDFVEEGIKVNGHWFPIVMMEWVDALPLNVFIEEHLFESAAIRCVRANIRTMLAQLAAARIAHGDLQHGNILVKDCVPVLVDYDSMFVDALFGRDSIEVGHRNYQHPGRAKSHFGPYLDNFSAWIIDTALLALSLEPELWSRFSGSGENLLFTHRDLAQPSSSWLFQHLITHCDQTLSSQAQKILEFLSADPAVIPPLDGLPVATAIAPVSQTPADLPVTEEATRAAKLPDWLDMDYT